jgi:hypothetical protein
MISVLVCLILVVTSAALGGQFPQPSPDCKQVSLPCHIAGRVLTLCVEAGMTPDQATLIFGEPELLEKSSGGPISGGYTIITYTYVRYGVTISFFDMSILPTHRTGPQAERMGGGLDRNRRPKPGPYSG